MLGKPSRTPALTTDPIIFFTTSADSASLVVDTLCSGWHVSPTRQRVFRGVTQGVVAATVLTATGGAGLVLFTPCALDLTGRSSDFQAVLIGVAVWATTVVLADPLRRAGLRGPAEAFLRDRTYARGRRVE